MGAQRGNRLHLRIRNLHPPRHRSSINVLGRLALARNPQKHDSEPRTGANHPGLCRGQVVHAVDAAHIRGALLDNNVGIEIVGAEQGSKHSRGDVCAAVRGEDGGVYTVAEKDAVADGAWRGRAGAEA